MASDLAASILDRLGAAFTAAADPARATAMAAYMRDQFPFLGIPGPAQKSIARSVLTGLPRPVEADLRDVALGCWALEHREYQYFACSYLRRHVRLAGPGFLTTARHLVVTKPWWDTVDALAAHVVGPLVLATPALASTMDEWLTSDDLWLARTALLHQLAAKERTDAARLFHYCAVRAGHTDFFIRKAIGWALREYAKTDPAAVRRFVGEHPELSGLSVREALKHL